MNPLSFIYHELLFRPLFNLLAGITNILPAHNVGVSIILVTIAVRLILLPSSLHQAKQMAKNQNKMNDLKKELEEIKKKHKDDQAKQAEATFALYRKAGINPAGGCLPLLIQLPILIALYRVFLTGLGPETSNLLYSFVGLPDQAQLVFLGISLTAPSLLLGIIAGCAQFILMRFFTTTPTPPAAANDNSSQLMTSMQRNMMYIFPVMTVFIALQLPAALALYWVASTIFAIVQQYFFKRLLNVTSGAPI